MSIQVCRTCLAHDTLMFTIADSPLLRFYEKITDLTFNTEDGRPSAVCYICYHMLKKCHRFTQSAIKADEVLQQICKSGIQITKHNIGIIDKSLLFSYQRSPVTYFITPSEKLQNVEIKRENIEVEIKQERMDASEARDIDEKDLKQIVIEVEAELNIKKTEEDICSPEGTVHPQDLHYSSDLDDEDDVDDPLALDSISIKEENGVDTEESVPEMYEQEMRAAPEPKKRKPEGTTTSSKEDLNVDNSTKSVAIARGTNDVDQCTSSSSVRSETLTGGKWFTCNYCDRKYKRNNHLSRHLRTHTGEKPFTCKFCGKKFTDNSSLSRHLRIHTGEMPFTCNFCGKKFNQNCTLSAHLRTHTGEKPFTCKYCGMKFTESGNMLRHLRIHTGEKPYTCDYCGFKSAHRICLMTHKCKKSSPELKERRPEQTSTSSKEDLNVDNSTKSVAIARGTSDVDQCTSSSSVHSRTHADGNWFICSYCNKKFTENSRLSRHLRKHTGERPFTCNYCNKKFTRNEYLSKHLRTHTGEKPYTCNYCDKKFTRRDYLSKHLRTHTGEKPFTCNFCYKKFSRSNYLSVHLRTHTGEKNFTCNYCEKKFTTKSTLSYHLKTHG